MLYNIKKNKCLAHFNPSKDLQSLYIHYHVTWFESDRAMVSSENGIAYVIGITQEDDGSYNMKILEKFQHPDAVIWSDVSNSSPKQIATACQDGKIRIFTADDYILQNTLTGHAAKVHSVLWHPTFPYILASSSDDKNVVVWDIKNVNIRFNFRMETKYSKGIPQMFEPYVGIQKFHGFCFQEVGIPVLECGTLGTIHVHIFLKIIMQMYMHWPSIQ
jgi:WD40 repeat protein